MDGDYAFERLRAKVLSADRLQKRVPIHAKVKKEPKFDEVGMARYMSLVGSFEDECKMKLKTRMAPIGTALFTLERFWTQTRSRPSPLCLHRKIQHLLLSFAGQNASLVKKGGLKASETAREWARTA